MTSSLIAMGTSVRISLSRGSRRVGLVTAVSETAVLEIVKTRLVKFQHGESIWQKIRDQCQTREFIDQH